MHRSMRIDAWVVIACNAGCKAGVGTSVEKPRAKRVAAKVRDAQRYRIKRISACGGCLGDHRRRRTWQPAKSCGELANEL